MTSDVIDILKNQFASKLLPNNNIVSILIYGHSAELLIEQAPLESNEIDLMVVVNQSLKPGEPPVSKKSISFLLQQKILDRDIRIVFNGEGMDHKSKWMYLDIIGDGLPNILARDPSSKIVSKKPRILLYGTDHYSKISEELLTKDDIKALFKIMDNYIMREFIKGVNLSDPRSISKNAIFIGSLLSPYSVRTNNKKRIVEILRNLDISQSVKHHLDIFVDGYHDKLDHKLVKSTYLKFRKKFRRQMDVLN